VNCRGGRRHNRPAWGVFRVFKKGVPGKKWNGNSASLVWHQAKPSSKALKKKKVPAAVIGDPRLSKGKLSTKPAGPGLKDAQANGPCCGGKKKVWLKWGERKRQFRIFSTCRRELPTRTDSTIGKDKGTQWNYARQIAVVKKTTKKKNQWEKGGGKPI